VWAVTDLGRSVDAAQTRERVRAWRADYNRRYHEQRRNAAPDEDSDDVEPVEPDRKDILLERLIKVTPDGFDRLAQPLLREAGFRNVEVLGKSGDGGIDGVGVYRLSLCPTGRGSGTTAPSYTPRVGTATLGCRSRHRSRRPA
jgi:restriction system protein